MTKKTVSVEVKSPISGLKEVLVEGIEERLSYAALDVFGDAIDVAIKAALQDSSLQEALNKKIGDYLPARIEDGPAL